MPMKEITVLLLDQMFSSTAIGPAEVFRHAGSLWNILTGMRCEPSFHVTTASADGRPVRCDGDIQIKPNVALEDVGKTDLIFVPTTGLSVDDVVERNAAIVPWLKRRSTRGVGFAIVPLKTDHTDDNISSAQEWMHKNFAKTFPLEDPARRVGMSTRNFERRFKQATGDSPLIYLQKLRIAAAKRMLEGNHRSMQEISEAVGYQDVVFFRTLFQRHTGVAPSAYRERFGIN